MEGHLPGHADPLLSDAHFQALVEHVPAVVFTTTNDLVPHHLYVNPQVERMTGYTSEAFLADDGLWSRVMHPDDRPRVLAAWEYGFHTHTEFDAEYRCVTADGRVIWVRDKAVPAFDQIGNVVAWHGVVGDITEFKQAEQELLWSEAKYRALVEGVPAVVYISAHDPQITIQYISPNVEEVLGYPVERYLAEAGFCEQTMHPDDVAMVMQRWGESFAQMKPFLCEYRYIRPDGAIVWVRDATIPVPGEDGVPLYWQGVTSDITDAKRSEIDLAESEARYRALVENIPAVFYEMRPDDDRRTVYMSPQVERILGYPREEWLDQPDIWIELLHPDDRETELAAHDLHNETGEPWSREYRLIAEDGRFVWVRDQALLVRDRDGAPMFWQGVMLDVTAQKELEEQLRRVNDELEFRVLARTTELAEANEMMSLEIGERKRAEEQVREAEERYRTLVERMPAVAYVWEANGGLPDGPSQAYIGPQVEQLLGYTPTEWLAEPGLAWQRVHPHDRKRVLDASTRSERTGEPFRAEYRFLAKDGRVVWVLDQATLIHRDRLGQPLLFQGVMIDITDRKDAEAKAAEAEARYRLLAEQGPIVAYVWERSPVEGDAGPVTYISPQVEELLGYPPGMWQERPGGFLRILHPDDRDWVLERDADIGRTGEPWALEYRVIARDGRVVWLHDEGALLSRDEDGIPKSFHGILLDITERKAEEQRLVESEDHYRSLAESLPGIPWKEVVDPETGRGRITYIGPQVERMFGYGADELVSEPDHFERMVHPDDHDRVMAKSALVDESGEPWNEIFRVIARDGRVVWVHGRAEMVREGSGRRVWHGVTVDVTEEVESGALIPPHARLHPAG